MAEGPGALIQKGKINQGVRNMPVVSMKELLEAGVHFGHQTRRWNPKMKPYIYDERNGIYIIDLHKTRKKLEEAYAFMKGVAYRGGKILFVGTKKQAQDSVAEAAQKCGMFYVNQRWLGGMLTNWNTIRARIERLNQLHQWQREGILDVLPKKESARLVEEMEKLERVLGGIKGMGGLPHAVFVMDLKKEHIAVKEARKLEIPLVGLVDTNCDPDEVDYVIPGNDDAIRALKLMAHQMADATLEGVGQRRAEEEKATAEAAEAEKIRVSLEEGGTEPAAIADAEAQTNETEATTAEASIAASRSPDGSEPVAGTASRGSSDEAATPDTAPEGTGS